MDELEELEQSIIQHVRTAGIFNKAKETAIVEKILNLRRDRRKLFSSLQQEFNGLKAEMTSIAVDFKNSEDNAEKLRNQLRLLVESHESEIGNLKCKFDHSMKTLEEKHTQRVRSKMAELQRNYENKVQILEKRVDEVRQEKLSADNKAAATIAAGLVKKAGIEIENKYIARISE